MWDYDNADEFSFIAIDVSLNCSAVHGLQNLKPPQFKAALKNIDRVSPKRLDCGI